MLATSLMLVCVALTLVFVPLDIEKAVAMFYLRLATPRVPKTPAPHAPASAKPFVVAFDEKVHEDNLFYQKTKDVWQRLERHQLVIRLGKPDQTIETPSYSTTIVYMQGRLEEAQNRARARCARREERCIVGHDDQ